MPWFSRRLTNDHAALAAHPRVYPFRPARFLADERGKAVLQSEGCVLVDSAEDADWVLLDRAKNVQRFAGKAPNILVFTHEPRYAIGAPHLQVVSGSTVHTYELSLGHFQDILDVYLMMEPQPYVDPATPRPAGTVLLATHQPARAYDHPADLIGLRAEFAEYGVRRGLLDLYGRGWEPLPTKGESRGGTTTHSWSALKHELIAGYKFNIALENTYLPNYVTEKIWQAAQAGCLPVYLGSSWMDRIVDPALYVDLRDHATPRDLFRALTRIGDAERIQRVRELQERLTELRASAERGVLDRWRHEAARKLIDLNVQEQFFGGPWGRDHSKRG